MARRWIDKLTRRRVVVHTTDSQSMTGVLTGAHRDCLVLTAASYMHPGGKQAVDGDLVVPRARVSWIQVLPEEAP